MIINFLIIMQDMGTNMTKKSAKQRNALNTKRIDYFYLLIGIITVIVVSAPLFGRVIYTGHDTFFHTQRILSIKNALVEGQFPVRIYSEIFDGYGYGSSLFYPELFLYIPAVMVLLGVPVTISYNFFLLLINIATMVIAVYSFTKITNSKEIGMISAILYELSVYRMLDLYARGSMGEFLALVFCPLVLCGLVLISRGETDKWWTLTIGFSGIVQSHILSFVMMVIVAFLFVAVNWKRFWNVKAFKSLFTAAAWAILINLWFLVPFLHVSSMDVNALAGDDRFWLTDAQIIQLFDVMLLSPVGGEPYSAGVAGSIPKTPGAPIILGCALLVFCLMLEQKEERDHLVQRTCGYLVAGLLALCMTTNIFPWDLIKKCDFLKSFFEKFQFMWRFNVVVVLLLSVVAAHGYFVFLSRHWSKKETLVLVSLLLSVYALMYINGFVQATGAASDTVVVQEGHMDDLYLTRNSTIFEREALESNATDIEYSNYEKGNSRVSLEFSIQENDKEEYYIDVPLTYYPVYEAKINGNKAGTGISDGGVVRVYIPEGIFEGELTVSYAESLAYRLMDILSLLSFVGFAAVLCVKKRSISLHEKKAQAD